MSKHPNNEQENFDDMIRRKLEEYPLDFDSGAWSAMEKKLDQEGGGGATFGRAGKIAGVVALLLLCSLAGWYILSQAGFESERAKLTEKELQINGNTFRKAPPGVVVEEEFSDQAGEKADGPVGNIQEPREEKEKIKVGSEQNRGISQPAGSRIESDDYAKALPDDDLEKPEKKQSKKILTSFGGKGNEFAKEKAEGKNVPVSELETGNSPSSAMKKNYKSSLSEEKELLQPELPIAGPGATANQNPEAELHNEEEAKEGAGEQDLLFPQRKRWELLPIIVGSVVPSTAESVPEEDIKEVTPIVVPGEEEKDGKGIPLSVMVSVAPDFTGTGQKGSSKIGAGAGIFLEYEFLPNLALVTGAFYSKKNYLTNDSFSPYGKFWDYRPAPNYIDASCGVIDIPLNLRYYALNWNRSRLFVSAGASSYLMKSEDYTLVYESSYYDDFTYSIEDQNKHLFAIYNFSVGYQRSLGSRWSLQLEPFMKIPAKGVGIGLVKLNSMGAFLHLKYSFGK